MKRDTENWEEWLKMHEDVQWFDTAACMNGKKTGEVNDLKLVGTRWMREQWRNLEDEAQNNRVTNGWYSGVKDLALTDYKTDLMSSGGSIGWADKLAGETERDWFFDECDIDCQARGSGLSTVGILNQISLGIIMLNAILMFAGTWRFNDRVISVYCTFAACLIQLIMLIISATYIFSIYSMQICSRSMTETAPGLFWTMHDDYYQNVYCWIVQIPLMFMFCCSGMIPAFKFAPYSVGSSGSSMVEFSSSK